jgi:hypothetical protein
MAAKTHRYRMRAVFVQIILLGLTIRLGWLAIAALRTGTVTHDVRYGPSRKFSRAEQPGAFWTTVGVYLLFVATVATGLVLRLLLP